MERWIDKFEKAAEYIAHLERENRELWAEDWQRQSCIEPECLQGWHPPFAA